MRLVPVVPVVAAAALVLLPAPARAATAAVVPIAATASYTDTVVYGATCSYSDGVLTASATATAVDSAVPATVWARCSFMDAEETRELGGIEASGPVASANAAAVALPPDAARLCVVVIAYHPGLYPGYAGTGRCDDLRGV